MSWRDIKVFFNSAVWDETAPFEALALSGFANLYLWPVRYLFNGDNIFISNKRINNRQIKQITLSEKGPNTDGKCLKCFKTIVSAALVIPCAIGGGVLKGFAHWASPEVKKNHQIAKLHLAKRYIKSR